jgi:putative endonuclease
LGEIDLVALDSDRLTFIEVRYRSRSDFGSALASVSPAKQQKVLMTAQIFLASHEDYCNRYCRFDIIAFDGPRGSVSAQWLKGAFGLAEHPNYE